MSDNTKLILVKLLLAFSLLSKAEQIDFLVKILNNNGDIL